MEKEPKLNDPREQFMKPREIIWEDLLHENEGVCEQTIQGMIDRNILTTDEIKELLIEWSKSNSEKYIGEIEGKSAYIGGGIQKGQDDKILQGWLWVLKRLDELSQKFEANEAGQNFTEEARKKIFDKYPYAKDLEPKSYFS